MNKTKEAIETHDKTIEEFLHWALTEDASIDTDTIETAVESIKAQHQELIKLREALAYYANIDLYEGVSLGVAPINTDRGNVARHALEQTGETKETDRV